MFEPLYLRQADFSARLRVHECILTHGSQDTLGRPIISRNQVLAKLAGFPRVLTNTEVFFDPSVQILMSFLCGTMFALPLPPLFSFPALLDTASIARPAWSYISSFPASFATFVPKCCPSGPGHATDVKDSTGNADFSTPRFKAACARLRAAVCRIQLRELLVSPHAVDEIESFILSGPSPSKSPQQACSNSNVRCGTFGTVRNFEVIAGTTWTFFRGVSISKGTTLR